MSIVATLLDKARTRRGIPTDMALAERLGRSRAVVSEWRAGKSYPDEDLIVALAELAGDDPGEWLLAVKAVRTDGKAGKVWAALAKRLGAAAAVVAVGVVGALLAHASGHDVAGLIAGLPFLAVPLGGDVHYAKYRVGPVFRNWPMGLAPAPSAQSQALPRCLTTRIRPRGCYQIIPCRPTTAPHSWDGQQFAPHMS